MCKYTTSEAKYKEVKEDNVYDTDEEPHPEEGTMPGTEENRQHLRCALEECNTAMSLVKSEPRGESIKSHVETKGDVIGLRKQLED